MGLFPPHRLLLIVLAAVVSLVAPVAPVAAAPGDAIAASAQVEPAVVRVDTAVDYQGVIGTGTGIVLDPGGQVLTNFHVIQGADRITGTVGGQPYPAHLVGYDRGRDVAVIQLIGAGGLPAAVIGDSNALVPGEPVVALGNAMGSRRSADPRGGHGDRVRPDGGRRGRADRNLRRADRPHRVRRAGARRRLRRTRGQRGRAGRRHHDRGVGELPDGSRRQGLRDPDQ